MATFAPKTACFDISPFTKKHPIAAEVLLPEHLIRVEPHQRLGANVSVAKANILGRPKVKLTESMARTGRK